MACRHAHVRARPGFGASIATTAQRCCCCCAGTGVGMRGAEGNDDDGMGDENDFLDSYASLLTPDGYSSSRTSMPQQQRMAPLSGFDLWYSSIVDVPCTQSAEWNIFLSFVSDEERIKIMKFRFDDDRKRALVSILLQKAFVRHRIGAANDEDGDTGGFIIRRTPEGKPYASLKGRMATTAQLGHWNYNLSHHGQFVAIVSHPKYIIGIDLVDISTRSPSIRTARSYVEMFDRNLDQKELAFILG